MSAADQSAALEGLLPILARIAWRDDHDGVMAARVVSDEAVAYRLGLREATDQTPETGLTEAERLRLMETVRLHRSARAVSHRDSIAWTCEGCGQPLADPDPALAFGDLVGHQVAEQIATVEAILRERQEADQ